MHNHEGLKEKELNQDNISSNGYYLGRNYQQQVLRSHILQNDMRWNLSNTTNKAMKTLNFIKRNFYHTSTGTKEKLYSMLAKPHLNYATAAWDPHTTKNINELERIQNAAARFIKGIYGKDTSVTALKESLAGSHSKRRDLCRARVTCLYKMVHGKVDIDHKLYTSPKPDRSRRVHGQQFKIDQVRTDCTCILILSKNDQRLEQPTKILSNRNNREWIQNITAKSKLKLKQKLATNLDNTPPV